MEALVALCWTIAVSCLSVAAWAALYRRQVRLGNVQRRRL